MAVDSWTLDGLVEAYKRHQRRTRGLREQTLRGYERLVRRSSEPRWVTIRSTPRVLAART